MILERFESKGLAHYSYAVVCEESRQMAVVDPQRDIDVYLEFAKRASLKIHYVLETHIHADYASGARQLSHDTGAALCLSAYDNDQEYQVSFAHQELRDGESLTFGKVRLEVLHTPGHTPEHLSFLLFDLKQKAAVPTALLTGDFLFIGSLGRPDLLGEQAKHQLALALFKSVQEKLPALPDSLEIHPAHGAGSLCGAGMSSATSSTLGEERRTNPYLAKGLTQQAFVERILGSTPPLPPYYLRMKKLNSLGPAIFASLPGDRALTVSEFEAACRAGAWVVDLRTAPIFGAGHIAGSLNLGGDDRLVVWASWLLPSDKPLILVSDDAKIRENAVRALVRVGLDQVAGYLGGGIEAWTKAAKTTATLPQKDVVTIQRELESGAIATLLDVRTLADFDKGHAPHARHLWGGEVVAKIDQLRQMPQPLAITCASGYRSSAISSYLKLHGIQNVANVTGGMNAWKQAGLPVES